MLTKRRFFREQQVYRQLEDVVRERSRCTLCRVARLYIIRYLLWYRMSFLSNTKTLTLF
jgi:hypothetical protein